MHISIVEIPIVGSKLNEQYLRFLLFSFIYLIYVSYCILLSICSCNNHYVIIVPKHRIHIVLYIVYEKTSYEKRFHCNICNVIRNHCVVSTIFSLSLSLYFHFRVSFLFILAVVIVEFFTLFLHPYILRILKTIYWLDFYKQQIKSFCFIW